MRDVSQDPLALAELDLEGLRSVWRSRYGPPPSLRSPELLALMLGYRMQAEREGRGPARAQALVLPTAAARSDARHQAETRLAGCDPRRHGDRCGALPPRGGGLSKLV